MSVLSNTDALLLAVPMIGLLVVGFFRLDELVGKPKKSQQPQQGHQLSHLDKNGRVVCVEPDGKLHRRPAGRN